MLHRLTVLTRSKRAIGRPSGFQLNIYSFLIQSWIHLPAGGYSVLDSLRRLSSAQVYTVYDETEDKLSALASSVRSDQGQSRSE